MLSSVFHTNFQPFLTNWFLLRVIPFTWYKNKTHGRCERLTGGWGGGLPILGTWSQLWYIQKSVFVPFSNFYFQQDLILVMYAILHIE
jgi:hypothetical protein